MLMKSIKITLLCLTFLVMSLPSLAQDFSMPPNVYIEDMTWPEVKKRLQGGYHTAIVPTGATQQQGPHMVTGYHNTVVRYTAGEIALKLGNALVAPVIAYSPAGRISPPEGHMQFPGTMSVSAQTYEMLLEDAIRSLKEHGFTLICLIGDNVGSQLSQARVAQKLSVEWRSEGVRVLNVSNYFYKNGDEEWAEAMPVKVAHPEAHGGHAETSQLMAIDADGVRDTMRAVRRERDYKTSGAMGDSSVASAKLGRKYLSLKIEAAIRQIQNASSRAR